MQISYTYRLHLVILTHFFGFLSGMETQCVFNKFKHIIYSIIFLVSLRTSVYCRFLFVDYGEKNEVNI